MTFFSAASTSGDTTPILVLHIVIPRHSYSADTRHEHTGTYD
eukprot:CAMPEP_0185756954 /NCGR_PEP_ID=MMETSP1174-20130828/15363_1 /TAXON_ID=35687 /ORGANISM="Dictyocha speculum, Strain CCMP1381" /LENGTH=41 /DNA_ID= /DNA_START= /DNA_END= /DNA_ORIENTATION=